LTIIYIYFNFTIALVIIQFAHFPKSRHVDDMDWITESIGLGYTCTL